MPFLHAVTVQASDIDELDHASNLVYLRWVLEAALAHSASLGWDQRAFLARGQSFVVRRHEIDYLRPALAGDALVIETRVASVAAASSVRVTRILRPSDAAVLCRARTDWAYLDLKRGRPVRIPEDIKRAYPIEEEPGKGTVHGEGNGIG
jgi:acyl-CoA thioester hydrolase